MDERIEKNMQVTRERSEHKEGKEILDKVLDGIYECVSSKNKNTPVSNFPSRHCQDIRIWQYLNLIK
jgi:hypothetical protein